MQSFKCWESENCWLCNWHRHFEASLLVKLFCWRFARGCLLLEGWGLNNLGPACALSNSVFLTSLDTKRLVYDRSTKDENSFKTGLMQKTTLANLYYMTYGRSSNPFHSWRQKEKSRSWSHMSKLKCFMFLVVVVVMHGITQVWDFTDFLGCLR